MAAEVWGRRATWGVLAGFALLALAYGALLPAFEGPDEPEHARYVEAWVRGAEIEAVAPGEDPRWGYEVIQPPLYYALVAAFARWVEPEFPRSLVLNPEQNPRFPFLRHDTAAERFPWSGPERGVRLLRLPSLLFGLASALVLLVLARTLFPDDSWAQALLLALALLAPSFIQAFAIVSNDGLTILWSLLAVTLAVRVIRERTPVRRGLAACGAALGLALASKLSAAIGLLVVLGLLGAGIARGRARLSPADALAFSAPLLAIAGASLLDGWMRYGDATRQTLIAGSQEGLRWAEAPPVGFLLKGMLYKFPPAFLADLCWQTYGHGIAGVLLFWTWLASLAIWSVLAARTRDAAAWLPLLATGAGLAFLLYLNRRWSSLQLRHVLTVWPLLVLAPVFAIGAAPALWIRVRRALVPAVALALVALNVSLLVGLRELRQPPADAGAAAGADRDYHRFVYAYAGHRSRGMTYLSTGSFLDFDVLRAAAGERWREVLDLVEAHPPPAELSPQGWLAYATALVWADRQAEALPISAWLAPQHEPSRPLHVWLLLAAGERSQARAALRTYLADSGPDVTERLRELERSAAAAGP
jgi:hypothetical protein